MDKLKDELRIGEAAGSELDWELLSEFAKLEMAFDERDFATHVIQQSVDVSAYLSRLNSAVKQLDESVHAHVVAHHKDLLSHAVGIEKLESVLEMMQSRTATLLSTITKIVRRVRTPHDSLIARVAQLRRMQVTCEVLRKTVRVLQLADRLQNQKKDVVKASQLVNELEYLFDSMDWSGIEILETNRRIATQAREELESQAWKLLSSAYELTNTSQLGTSLQVFHNLQCLDRIVKRLMGDWREEIHKKLSSSLDTTVLMQQAASRAATVASANVTSGGMSGLGGAVPSVPGRAAMPVNAGQAAAFRAGLWTNLDNCLDHIYQVLYRVRLLVRILGKRRDHTSQRCLLEVLQERGAFEGEAAFISWIAEKLREQFLHAADTSNFFKQAFEGEFPKLVKLFTDFACRAHSSSMGDSISDASVLTVNSDIRLSETPFWSCLITFENAYLSRSLSRLFDPVELSFATLESVPSNEELESMVRTISSEITFSTVHPELLHKVGRNVSKTIRLLATKAEQSVVTDGEASQVVGPLTTGQALNVRLINAIGFFINVFQKEIGYLKLPSSVMAVIEEPLSSLEDLMKAAIQPLLQSISDSLESIIITMHQEDFGGGLSSTAMQNGVADVGGEKCSLYMQELTEFVVRAKAQYLSQFSVDDFIKAVLLPHVERCIDVFLIHASILRPVGEKGKMRLAVDCAHLEKALSPLCQKLSDCGSAYRRLRAFRPLLFQTLDNVADFPGVGDTLPVSLVVHHLFTRAPPELLSPHQAATWSVGRYSNWLLSHPAEADRLQFIRGAVDAYAQLIRTKGERKYCPVYPVMVRLLGQQGGK